MKTLFVFLVSVIICSSAFGEDIQPLNPDMVDQPTSTANRPLQHKKQPWQSDTDNLLYQKVLKQIVEHDNPKQFAIWNDVIPANIFASQRTPRHLPDHQFSRYMSGVTPDMELSLLYKGIDTRGLLGNPRNTQLLPLETNIVGHEFIGFLDTTELQRIESTSNQTLTSPRPLVIGFSRVGYQLEQKKLYALLYTEVGLLSPDGPYGGEGFLFVKQGEEWIMKTHTYLWQGWSTPFWR